MKIAIDGPAGAGKSTIARQVAKKLGYTYLDTGAMYRALTYTAIQRDISPSNSSALASIVSQMDLQITSDEETGGNRIFVDGEDITEAIRKPVVSGNVSEVSSHAEVRKVIVDLQKRMAEQGQVVMDGRDIGTVVMPDADWKFFLTASVSERARRRQLELSKNGHEVDLKELERQIQDRDLMDSTRAVSPLRKAEDAIHIDTTHMTIDEVVKLVLNYVQGGKSSVQSTNNHPQRHN